EEFVSQFCKQIPTPPMSLFVALAKADNQKMFKMLLEGYKFSNAQLGNIFSIVIPKLTQHLLTFPEYQNSETEGLSEALQKKIHEYAIVKSSLMTPIPIPETLLTELRTYNSALKVRMQDRFAKIAPRSNLEDKIYNAL